MRSEWSWRSKVLLCNTSQHRSFKQRRRDEIEERPTIESEIPSRSLSRAGDAVRFLVNNGPHCCRAASSASLRFRGPSIDGDWLAVSAMSKRYIESYRESSTWNTMQAHVFCIGSFVSYNRLTNEEWGVMSARVNWEHCTAALVGDGIYERLDRCTYDGCSDRGRFLFTVLLDAR